MVSRGEIWWAKSPSDKTRPVLVLTRSDAIQVLDRIVCVPLTRTVRGTPGELLLDEDDGVPHSCVANFDDLRTVPKKLLVQRIAQLHAERMHEVCETLNIALGC